VAQKTAANQLILNIDRVLGAPDGLVNFTVIAKVWKIIFAPGSSYINPASMDRIFKWIGFLNHLFL